MYPPPPKVVQVPKDFCIQIGKSSVVGMPCAAGPTGIKIWGNIATCGRQPSIIFLDETVFDAAAERRPESPMPPARDWG